MSAKNRQLGFIGLGIMGLPMASNLVKAGFSVIGFDVLPESLEAAIKAGCGGAVSVAEVAAQSDLIFTMLPNGAIVKQVTIGADGILEHGRAGQLVIDMSSIAPAESREIAARLAEKDIHLLDAPVSGGDLGAIAGSLAIMAGGQEEDFQLALPYFSAMGSAIHVGPTGSGTTCKLANQIIVNVNLAALAEGLQLARRAGADPARVLEAIGGGLAGSQVMKDKGPKMLNAEFSPGGRIDINIKDLKNALAAGDASESPLPLTAQVLEMFQTLRAKGLAGDDHSALYKYYQVLTGEL